MAKKPTQPKNVEAFTYDEASRKNIPTAEFQSVMEKSQQSPLRVAYERRNRDLDPQLVWRGKDEQDWSDLVVHAPPLYIQEKVHPKVLIDDLRRQTEEAKKTDHPQQAELDLFADFNGLPSEDAKTEFYQHDANWTNRMILGDSLQVMASLAEREGLQGKVQCIYIDPPYGIKFNSNFQWSTTSRDVKDGKAEHITREPEMVKAFRDTWRDGIHSYLTYLRDRLTVARDLLHESGSVFVQIGDENVHRVRALMDEVFGDENFCRMVFFKKTAGDTSNILPATGDFILWYAKRIEAVKFRPVLTIKEVGEGAGSQYNWVLDPETQIARRMTLEEKENASSLPGKLRPFTVADLKRAGFSRTATFDYFFQGEKYHPGSDRQWKTNEDGMKRLNMAGWLHPVGTNLRYRRYHEHTSMTVMGNNWTDTETGSFLQDKVYVVQTGAKVIERCILMSTDPGDLVLDPTCGSGTTAYVAEQWGRRWITVDTSRVSLALARARIMGARYPYYLLADSKKGQQQEAEITRTVPSEKPTHGKIRHGFVYERVPHVMLRDIAHNVEIDVIWERYEERLAPLRGQWSVACGRSKTAEEWEIPREVDKGWSEKAKQAHAEFWKLRIARQKEIDASIAAKADFEFLYDKPYEDKKTVRVAGPFTVESLSPHRTLGVNYDDELIDPLESVAGGQCSVTGGGEVADFAQMVMDNLQTSGVQQAHKDDKINFSSIAPWPGRYICAEGRYAVASGQCPVTSNAPTTGHQPPATANPATDHRPPTTDSRELRAGIFVGPEFGTVSRQDLVAAAREAGDADFDVLIACAFNYEAHASEFDRLGRIPVLKARMNADLHMADDLKNTGKGNLFVIFGEPDISVVGGQWLVASNGREIACYDSLKELPGLGSLEEINRLGRKGIQALGDLSDGRTVWDHQSDSKSGHIGGGKHSGGSGAERDGGVPALSEHSGGIAGRSGNLSDSGSTSQPGSGGSGQPAFGSGGDTRSDAQRAQALAALKELKTSDFPLSLTTGHRLQVTVHGVDVFHPQTGEVRSDGAEGIACWFIDTDYNEESFFVRHAYFLGQNDPYKSLKTTLKAEIDEEAWETLHSDTSRPFDKPKGGRIAVKVINHLGDEVMKVFRV